MELEDNKIKKSLKSYLAGKKYFESDKDKSFDYFKQCINIINDVKKSGKNNKYNDIINETEIECNKMLDTIVESNIETELVKIDINLFDIVDTGDIKSLDNVKDKLDFYTFNEEGLTPLHKAIDCGDTTFLSKMFRMGAEVDATTNTNNGLSLLEYACLENDQNIIQFLMNSGTNIKKHLFFRDGNIKFFNKTNQIDIAIILKLILIKNIKVKNNELNFIFNHISPNTHIGLDTITMQEFSYYLAGYISTLDCKDTYIDIIKEELETIQKNKLGCPQNKLDILLYNIVPFISYPFNLSLSWLVNLEIKYIILKVLKKRNKKDLGDLLYKNYIKNDILPQGFIFNLISQWKTKIKL